PYAKYIYKKKPKKPKSLELTPEEEARQLAAEEKAARRLKTEEVAVSKMYSLVRQGEYHGVFNNQDCTQVLFHEESQAREYLRELIHGRDSFRSYYGDIT